MKKIWKDIKPSMFSIYLGFSLGVFCNTTFLNWQLYAVIVPTLILESMFNKPRE